VSTITSPEVPDSYRWSGAANNSYSIHSVRGVAQRANYATRPQLEAGSNSGNRVVQTRETSWWQSDGASVGITPDGSGNTDSFLTLSYANMTPGRRYTVSAFVQLPEAQTTHDATRARRIVIYGAGEGTVMSDQLANVRTRVGNARATFTYQEGMLVRLYNGSSVEGEMVRWDSPIITDSDKSPTYFSGATVATRTASSTPLLVNGFETRRDTRSVLHTVMGRTDPDVTLLPATLRIGTLRLLFDNETDAAEADAMHAQPQVFTFRDSDLSSVDMKYVVSGAVTRSLDDASRSLWTVGVDFQEVTS
jgi:hypothetical protein